MTLTSRSVSNTVYMACSERLPTRLDPLADRTCFSFLHLILFYYAEGFMASCMRDHIIMYFPPAERTCFSQVPDYYIPPSVAHLALGAQVIQPPPCIFH